MRIGQLRRYRYRFRYRIEDRVHPGRYIFESDLRAGLVLAMPANPDQLFTGWHLEQVGGSHQSWVVDAIGVCDVERSPGFDDPGQQRIRL
jgi:hypothetical protein